MNTKNELQLIPLGLLAKIADKVMIPLMYLLSGTFKESPQKTHRWNNLKLNQKDISSLLEDRMIFCRGLADTLVGWKFKLPLMHIPIFGGWRTCVVLEPVDYKREWCIGWTTSDVSGVSLIPVHGPVRVLVGPSDTRFFGLNIVDTTQIDIKKIGNGKIGDNGPYKKIPLF